MRETSPLISLIMLFLISAGLAASPSSWAVHLIGNIELDGNTRNDGLTVPGIDDWDDVYKNTDNALRSVFLVDSAVSDRTTFDGGVKDIQSLDKWTCNTATPQNKSNILHAYGATYSEDGNLYFYAGADRESNLGDSNIGVWLFQGPVGCVSSGRSTPFTGTHLDGDLLMVAEFDNGGRVESIKIYRWSDPDRIPANGDECLGGILGDCSDEGLPAYQGLNCSDSNPGDQVCGRTNPVSSINAAWRTGIPRQGFFEVGANLTTMISGIGCFASAIIETRSSTSLTATLKDFVAVDLPTCGTLSIEKNTSGGNDEFGFSIDPGVGNIDTFDLSGGENLTFTTVEPGIYAISEAVMPAGPVSPNGWNLEDIRCAGGSPGVPDYTDGGHGGGNIAVNIDLNDDVVCTFSNEFTPPPASITIQKNCESTSPVAQDFVFTLAGFGGSSTAACATGSLALACGDAITCRGLGAGDYTVNESVPAGWLLSDVSCDGDLTDCSNSLAPQVSITLDAGGAATATFTNSAFANIEICKSTQPSESGGAFSFIGDLGGFSLADGQCTELSQVSPSSTYVVTETGKAGFTLDSINCTGSNWAADANGAGSVSITPQAGETVSCTFFNAENPGYIRVCKTVITADNINAAFGIHLNGPDADLPVSTSLQGGECDLGPGDSGETSLAAGNGYAVSETVESGWDSSVSCIGSSGSEVADNIDVSPNETVVCTFTNTQRGSISILKVAAGADGNFDFSGDLGAFVITTVDGFGSMDFPNLVSGEYSISETGLPPGWDLNSAVCDDDDGSDPANLILDPGEAITCIFTNTLRGSITVIKNTVGADGTFSFGRNFGADFNVTTIDGSGLESFTNLTPGTYSVSENDPGPGWLLESATCTDDSTPDNINVVANGAVICTFTNRKLIPALTVQKTPDDQTIGIGGTANFTIYVENSGEIPLINVVVTDARAPLCGRVIGDLGIGENVSFNCALDDVRSNFTNIVEVSGEPIDGGDPVSASDTAFVTLLGNITIEKLSYGGDGSFDFTGDLGSFGISTVDGAGSQAFTDLQPGGYSISEVVPDGWSLDNAVCDDDDSTDPFELTLEAGEEITCVFTNTLQGSVTIIKNTVGIDGIFSFERSFGEIFNIETVDGSGFESFSSLTPGIYSVSENDPGPGWLLESATCTDDSTPDNINVVANGAVICTFTNRKLIPALTVQKTPDDQTIGIGGTANFTIYVENSGEIPLINVVVTDALAPLCGRVIGNLGIGENVSFNCALDNVRSIFTNIVEVSGEPIDGGDPVSASDTAFVTLLGNITIEKVSYGRDGSFDFTGDLGAFGITTVDGFGSMDFPNLVPGEYSISETGLPPGWDLNSAVCDDDDGSDPANLILDSGEAITCIFTNTLRGSITVIKNAVGADGTFSFERNFGAGFNITTIDGSGLESFSNLAPGTYSVSESDPGPGWVLESATCTDDSTPDNINVVANGAVICTFTNRKLIPALTVQKTPDDQTIGIGGTANFTIYVENSGEIPLINVVVTDALAPLCGRVIGNLGIGENVSFNCALDNVRSIFTNIVEVSGEPIDGGDPVSQSDTAFVTLLGNITIEKVSYGGDGSFDFTGDLGSFAVSTVDGAGFQTFTDLQPGSYSISEVVPEGWDLDSAVCDDDDSTNPFELTLEAGEEITCVFTNTLHGSITIIKNTVGADGIFSFERSFGESFSIETVDGSGQEAFANLTPGKYSISENDPGPGWILESATCTDESTPANINLTSDSAVVCTFTNRKLLPGVTIQKTPDYQGIAVLDTASFTIYVQNSGEIPLENVAITDVLSPLCDRNIGSLDVGEDLTYSCSIDNVPEGFTNIAEVSGEPIDSGEPVTNSDSADVSVIWTVPEMIPVNSVWALILLILSVLGFVWYRRSAIDFPSR